VPYTSEAAAVERGRYLYASRGCSTCHGTKGTGDDVVNDPDGMLLHPPNITPGAEAVARYAEVDWVRTIRHGVKPSGEPVLVMPSEDFNRFTDADLAAVVAYVRQLAPGAGAGAMIRLPMFVRALYGAGLIPDSAETIDHSLPPSTPVAEGVTAAHGAYVANACIGCHGASLSGGRIPGGPPDWPPAPNLTPGEGGVFSRYADAQALAAMFRSGKRPDGSAVNPAMPFGMLKAMSDVDVQALYLHLKTLPPKATGAGR
jgi:mono/diheme cytochrome c family protein